MNKYYPLRSLKKVLSTQCYIFFLSACHDSASGPPNLVCVFLTGVFRNNCYLVWGAPTRPCPGKRPTPPNGLFPTHPLPSSGPSKMRCHRAASTPAAGASGPLCCFLSLSRTSLSARGVTGQAETVGKGEGVVSDHPLTCQPPLLPTTPSGPLSGVFTRQRPWQRCWLWKECSCWVLGWQEGADFLPLGLEPGAWGCWWWPW